MGIGIRFRFHGYPASQLSPGAVRPFLIGGTKSVAPFPLVPLLLVIAATDGARAFFGKPLDGVNGQSVTSRTSVSPCCASRRNNGSGGGNPDHSGCKAVSRSGKTNNDKPGVVLPGVVVLVGLDIGGPVFSLWGAAPSGLSGFVGELGEVGFAGGFSPSGALFGG